MVILQFKEGVYQYVQQMVLDASKTIKQIKA